MYKRQISEFRDPRENRLNTSLKSAIREPNTGHQTDGVIHPTRNSIFMPTAATLLCSRVTTKPNQAERVSFPAVILPGRFLKRNEAIWLKLHPSLSLSAGIRKRLPEKRHFIPSHCSIFQRKKSFSANGTETVSGPRRRFRKSNH